MSKQVNKQVKKVSTTVTLSLHEDGRIWLRGAKRQGGTCGIEVSGTLMANWAMQELNASDADESGGSTEVSSG